MAAVIFRGARVSRAGEGGTRDGRSRVLLVLHLHESDRSLVPSVDVQFLINLFEMPADGFDRDAGTFREQSAYPGEGA